MDSELEELPTDYVRGLDFHVKKTQKGGYADYTTSNWARKESAITAEEQAVIDQYGLRHLAVFSYFGMAFEMAWLTMYRHDDLRADILIHFDQLVFGRVSRNMHIAIFICNDFNTILHQPVLQPANGKFVAGNDARREDDRIPLT